jgi:arginase
MPAPFVPSRPVHIVGVGSCLGAPIFGPAAGPRALRALGLDAQLRQRGIRARWETLLEPSAPKPPHPPMPDRLGLVSHLLHDLADTVAGICHDGAIPLVLGGDHAIGAGTWRGVARSLAPRGKLGLIWIDAHLDAHTERTTHTGNIHGMPVASLCGDGPPELVGIGGFTPQRPALRASELRQIGIRSVDAGEKRLVLAAGIEVFDMRFIDEHGMRATMERALAGVDADTHLHVSLDVDFLDPSIAPGVATTVPGGPTYREAQLCMEMVADTGRLASLDIVEINPAYDTHNNTAELAVDLVESLFGKSTLMRQRGAR